VAVFTTTTTRQKLNIADKQTPPGYNTAKSYMSPKQKQHETNLAHHK
jgi:hypothetical protein